MNGEGFRARAGRWLVLIGAPALVVLSMISYSQVALGTDQGRLLFPALAPIALLIGGGAAAWWRGPRAKLFPAIWAAGLAAAAILALVTGIVQTYAAPGSSAAQAATATPVNVSFGSQVSLASWTWDAGAGRLTLYWRADGPAREDLRAAARLVDEQGELLWEWKRSPGEGRYSTDRWRAGEVIADAYTPPADRVSRAARLEVGVYEFASGAWLQPGGGTADGAFLVLAPGPALR